MLKIIILESYLACRWRVRSIHLANGIVKKKTNNVEREREKKCTSEGRYDKNNKRDRESRYSLS
jgi:hypothetical protein